MNYAQLKQEIQNALKQPQTRLGKRDTGLIILAWLLLRAVQTALKLVAVYRGYIVINALDICLLGIAVLAAGCLYAFGSKHAAYVLLGAGALMLLQAAGYNLPMLTQAHFPASVRLYAISFVCMIPVQLLCPALILLLPRTRQYCSALGAVYKRQRPETKEDDEFEN